MRFHQMSHVIHLKKTFREISGSASCLFTFPSPDESALEIPIWNPMIGCVRAFGALYDLKYNLSVSVVF